MTFEEELNTIVNNHYSWRPIDDLPDKVKYAKIADLGIQLVKDLNQKQYSHSQQMVRIAQSFTDVIEYYNPRENFIKQLKQLLIEKNHDYGSSYAKVANIVGTIPSFSVRFLDKCNRLNSLLAHNGETDVSDENINDTVQDLLGYYILAVDVLKYHM